MKKRLLKFILAGILMLGLVGMAQATSFTLDSYDVALRDSDPGLVLSWSPTLGTPVTADLNVGQNTGWFKFFTIATDEVALNADDYVAYPIEVSFVWSAPLITGTDTVTGVTYGKWTLFGGSRAYIEWDGPATFTFGNGGVFTMELTDEDFRIPGDHEIYGRLSYVSGSTDVPVNIPEPMTMLLLGFGLMGLAGVKRKLKK